MTEIANCNPVLAKKMLTIEANKIPISPMKRNDPQPLRSFFVVYPYKLNAPKAPADIKKTLATASPVY